MERIFKVRAWYKGTDKFAFNEIIKTSLPENKLHEMIEGQIVNTEIFDYAVDEY